MPANINVIKTKQSNGLESDQRLSDFRISSGTDTPEPGRLGDIYLKKFDCYDETHYSNNWTYFTDETGLTICWKIISGNIDPSTTWGPYAETVDGIIPVAERTYPVTFKSQPAVHIFFNSPWAWGFTNAGANQGVTQCLNQGMLTIATNASGWGARNYRIEIIAIGYV